jgi:hypothetical protein
MQNTFKKKKSVLIRVLLRRFLQQTHSGTHYFVKKTVQKRKKKTHSLAKRKYA